jgi:hypothetical protein
MGSQRLGSEKARPASSFSSRSQKAVWLRLTRFSTGFGWRAHDHGDAIVVVLRPDLPATQADNRVCDQLAFVRKKKRFNCMALKKIPLSCMAFFFELFSMALKQTFIPSIAFYMFSAYNGVKWRVKRA